MTAEREKNLFDLRAIPADAREKVFSAAQQIVQMEVRREKLQRLRAMEREGDALAQISAMLAELVEAIDRERGLLGRLPHSEHIQPSLSPLPPQAKDRLALALHAAHGKWYPALVAELLADGAQALVAYVGYEERETLPAAGVRLLDALPDARAFRDSPCAFVDASTGRLHAAAVVEVGAERLGVRRRSDGRVFFAERRMVVDCRHAPESAGGRAAVILPNDSAEVRARKKKALKRRRYEARAEEAGEFFRERQRSWQLFKRK